MSLSREQIESLRVELSQPGRRSVSQIARDLGVSKGVVAGHLHRAGIRITESWKDIRGRPNPRSRKSASWQKWARVAGQSLARWESQKRRCAASQSATASRSVAGHRLRRSLRSSAQNTVAISAAAVVR